MALLQTMQRFLAISMVSDSAAWPTIGAKKNCGNRCRNRISSALVTTYTTWALMRFIVRKKGNFNIVFTDNKSPSLWRENYNEDDALLCSPDRIFNNATVFNIKVKIFRRKHLEGIALQTNRVKAPETRNKMTNPGVLVILSWFD